jgi:CheY-like chemotaxis protein
LTDVGAVASPSGPNGIGSLPPSLRVLIAEDSVTLQKLYLYNFGREGIKPAIANNGKEAVELTKAQDFDIILLDVLMPEMSGEGMPLLYGLQCLRLLWLAMMQRRCG